LRAQAIRAAYSIPSNIAEGCGKISSGELARFADIASGSATELQAHLEFARGAGIINDAEFAALDGEAEKVRRMLLALSRAVRKKREER
jgi:four helix bundle protein